MVLTDPAGDEDGPGTYVLPAVEGFRRGSFDLREVRIEAREDGGVDVRVTFQAAPQDVLVRTRTDSPGRRVFLPVVDLYASPGKAGEGHKELLPGRRVRAGGEGGWTRGVVLSAVPDLLENHYRKAAPVLATDLCFPRGVTLSGKVLVAHLAKGCLPADPGRYGWIVTTTALGSGASFSTMVRRMVGPSSPDAPDPYVRDVTPFTGLCNVWEDGGGPSPCSIGGCDPCEWAPFVLDAILPPGADQHALLKGYDPVHRRLATLPFVTFEAAPGAAPGAAPVAVAVPPPEPPREVRLPVAGVRGGQLTIAVEGTEDEVRTRYPPGTLGGIICPGDRPGGTVVVRGMAAGFLVLEKVRDGSPVCDEAVVVF